MPYNYQHTNIRIVNRLKHLFICGILICFSWISYADIRLPSIISSDMVLQQRSAVKLWGWSSPGEKIFVSASWNNTTDSVVADGDAKWILTINTPAAGGPYTISLKGHNTITLNNILIGEVWVCSGQSNMEWSSYNNLQQIIEELPKANNANIRLFRIPKTTATSPQEDCIGSWKVSSSESLKGFSAIGYFFAKRLQKELGVPVGIINASWGGTPAEAWTPVETVQQDNELIEAGKKINKSKWWPVDPGRAYNAMIAPLTNFSMAGALWYQGESNTGTYATYKKLFSSMIGEWRKKWQKDFPFYYVQIAPYKYGQKNIGALLQEAQTQTLSYPNVGMVVITDLVDNVEDIHPKNKLDVAERLANLALGETYKQKAGVYKSPLFKRMDIEKDKVVLYFDNAPTGFMAKGSAATEFYIAGADENFVPAVAKLEKDRIIVSAKSIKEPKAVRFGFSNTAMSNLFSKEGLPVTPFRTDDWKVDTSN
jgi:sialate O-acetylesterase